MTTYVLYKVCKTAGMKDSVTRMLSHDNIETLRNEANDYYADPAEWIGREAEQLIIPTGQLQSNVVTTVAGGQQYHRHIEIREIGKGKAQ